MTVARSAAAMSILPNLVELEAVLREQVARQAPDGFVGLGPKVLDG